jgi:hypothetical protein
MARLVKEYKQKHMANKLLKNLLNEKQEVEIKDDRQGLQKSINRLSNMYSILRHEFIKGNISKDQYEILNKI